MPSNARSESPRRLHARRGGLVLALGLACGAAPAAAQTRFAWPDTAVTLAAYATVEECHAAVKRVSAMTSAGQVFREGWRDTMPLAPGEVDAPLPEPVAATARACAQRYAAADSAPVADLALLVPLYLYAGWDAQARTLVDRRIAAIAPDAEDELAAVIDTVVSLARNHINSRLGILRGPPQNQFAEAVVTAHLPRVRDRLKKLRIYLSLMTWNASESVMDTAAIARLAVPAVAILDSLTEAERAKLEEEYSAVADGGNLAERFFAALNMTLGKQTFLAALRRSTAEFVKLKRDNWARATGQLPETFGWGIPLGEQAPTLEADFWLGRTDSTPRPTRGRVSLVVFLGAAECMGVPSGPGDIRDRCANLLVTLRRLEQRFPALETTVVAHTAGHFSYLKDSLPPAREAELTKRWIESYGVRASVAMTTTSFWRLPAPDNRRINHELPNHARYTFGRTWRVGVMSAFLVDQDGIIVEVGQLHRHSEPMFAELIEILLQREGDRT